MIPKFRAWHKKEKVMRPVIIINWVAETSEEVVLYYPEEGREPFFKCSFNEIILMQSTGLKDKNGKEIFEGDVVEIQTARGNPWKVEYLKQISSWNFVCLNRYKQIGNMNPIEKCSHLYEIIGNIHENPELLKKGD